MSSLNSASIVDLAVPDRGNLQLVLEQRPFCLSLDLLAAQPGRVVLVLDADDMEGDRPVFGLAVVFSLGLARATMFDCTVSDPRGVCSVLSRAGRHAAEVLAAGEQVTLFATPHVGVAHLAAATLLAFGLGPAEAIERVGAVLDGAFDDVNDEIMVSVTAEYVRAYRASMGQA